MLTDDTFDYQVLCLTDKFYENYPCNHYKEILKKKKRSYNCLLIQSHYGYFICIPYRSNITHKYAYMFKHSQRSRSHKSGLDYTKIVIISNPVYITGTNSKIDQDEYNETRKNIKRIKNEALIFVNDYINHMKSTKKLTTEEFHRRYHFSPLKYFHTELGIT